jgi:hypothetical protein
MRITVPAMLANSIYFNIQAIVDNDNGDHTAEDQAAAQEWSAALWDAMATRTKASIEVTVAMKDVLVTGWYMTDALDSIVTHFQMNGYDEREVGQIKRQVTMFRKALSEVK